MKAGMAHEKKEQKLGPVLEASIRSIAVALLGRLDYLLDNGNN